MIEIPRHADYRLHADRLTADETPCAICGKAVKNAQHWLYTWNGMYAVTEGEIAAIYDGTSKTGLTPAGDSGGYPIGAGCLKNHPELTPYLIADLADDEPSDLSWKSGPDIPCETCERITRDEHTPMTVDFSWARQAFSAEKADEILAALNADLEAKFGVSHDDDESTPSVLVGEPAREMVCVCGKTFWSLDSDHTECDACDEAAAASDLSWKSGPDIPCETCEALKQAAKAAPLPADVEGLTELAEHVVDGIESGDIIVIDEAGPPMTFVDDIDAQRDHDEAMAAVMFLTLPEAAFMERVCRHDGLVVWRHNEVGMQMALHLEQCGLVTIDRKHPSYVIVAAVRPEGEEDE